MTEHESPALPPWSLPTEAFERLKAQGESRRYDRRSIVITEGDTSDSMYIIASGRVRVFVSGEDGRELVLREMGPGEYFGDVVLDDQPRSASVITLEPCVFRVITKARFKALLASDPNVAFEILRSCMQRIRGLTRNLADLALKDCYTRVRDLLMASAVESAEGLVIRPAPSQKDIADRVSCTRVMVSRIFKQLREGAYIAENDDALLILRKLPKGF